MHARRSLAILLLCLLQACSTTAPLDWQEAQAQTSWLSKRLTFQLTDQNSGNNYLLVIESADTKNTHALILNAIGMLHTTININNGELEAERSALANSIMEPNVLLALTFLIFDHPNTANTLLTPWQINKQQSLVLTHHKHGQFTASNHKGSEHIYQVINDKNTVNLLIKKISSEPL